ncbi:hypothetical protein EVAR_63967_1 [Eumeta japonica]|uniref:Uncharacterized protein n=1 Tax=Eumeta variegata TaxID=151549 RepID=A0A4C1ZBM8_EUMVA|nr:hypothetical protein EVAR_63967_1 [Eumeta japonica]
MCEIKAARARRGRPRSGGAESGVWTTFCRLRCAIRIRIFIIRMNLPLLLGAHAVSVRSAAPAAAAAHGCPHLSARVVPRAASDTIIWKLLYLTNIVLAQTDLENLWKYSVAVRARGLKNCQLARDNYTASVAARRTYPMRIQSMLIRFHRFVGKVASVTRESDDLSMCARADTAASDPATRVGGQKWIILGPNSSVRRPKITDFNARNQYNIQVIKYESESYGGHSESGVLYEHTRPSELHIKAMCAATRIMRPQRYLRALAAGQLHLHGALL